MPLRIIVLLFPIAFDGLKSSFVKKYIYVTGISIVR